MNKSKINFKQIDIQKFDSSGNYILEDEYIFSYSYSDGFNERLLNVSFFVDIYYNCKVDLSFYKKGRINKIETQIEIKIPPEIKNLILIILNQDKLELKNHYSDIFLEDTPSEHCVINHKGISHNISIGIIYKIQKYENESENIIFRILKEFRKLREDIYQINLLEK